MPKIVTAEMSDEDHARYKELANKDYRSLRRYLSLLLERALREADKELKKPAGGE